MASPALMKALHRGVFHALVGSGIALALLLAPRLPVLVGLGIVTAIYVSVDIIRLRVPGLNRLFITHLAPLMRGNEVVKLTGASYFAIGSLIASLAFPVNIAAQSVLFLAFGDSAATVIGLWRGRVRYRGKSLEGHLACLVVCLLITWAFARAGYVGLAAGIVGAVTATVFEALSLPLNDSITIPLGSALAMFLVSLALA